MSRNLYRLNLKFFGLFRFLIDRSGGFDIRFLVLGLVRCGECLPGESLAISLLEGLTDESLRNLSDFLRLLNYLCDIQRPFLLVIYLHGCVCVFLSWLRLVRFLDSLEGVAQLLPQYIHDILLRFLQLCFGRLLLHFGRKSFITLGIL